MDAAVGIHGAAGAVGAATAYALAQAGARRLVLADAAAPRLACLAMDLEMLRAALPRLEAVATGGLDELAACELVVACAGVPHRDGAPRSAFFEANAAILAPLADALARPWAACRTLVLVSNPVDALATWLQGRLGERVRVVGHTLNDTLRLCVAIGRACGCDPAAVEAWSVGEHGPHAVPLLSRVRVRGEPVALSAAERRQVLEEVRGWYTRWQAHGTGTTSAWTSGWGAAGLVRALRDGDPRAWPVSTLLCGTYGVEGVCLTVPALLGPEAPPRPLQWRLDAEELAAIRAAAAAVEELACAAC
jgi:L-lactate dehydrogenase